MSSFDFAETCVFVKQSPGLLYCDRFMHPCGHTSAAPLLPKLRGYQAEFLNERSPERLRIFSTPTCVGLRYGRPMVSLEVFPGSVGSAASSAHHALVLVLRC